jgi:hypothetical protein
VGSTQAHISELERGLGKNGPTILTLARIVSELGETLLVDTRKRHLQQARRSPRAASARWKDLQVRAETDPV